MLVKTYTNHKTTESLKQDALLTYYKNLSLYLYQEEEILKFVFENLSFVNFTYIFKYDNLQCKRPYIIYIKRFPKALQNYPCLTAGVSVLSLGIGQARPGGQFY